MSHSAQELDRLARRRNAFTCALVQPSHQITGTLGMPNFLAAFSRKCPSITVPSLVARIGMTNPNSRILATIRPTTASLRRGFLSYSINWPIATYTIKMAAGTIADVSDFFFDACDTFLLPLW